MRKLRTLIAVTVACTAMLTSAGAATAANDMFLQVPTLPGDSNDAAFPDAIRVLAFSYGVSRDSKGDKTRPVSFSNFSVTKYLDNSSPTLLELVASGRTLPSAKLIVRRDGATKVEQARYCFTGVQFTSLSGGGSGGEDRLTENVSFSYQTLVQRYTPKNADGSAGTPLFGGWNVVDNLRFGNPDC